MKRQVHAVSPTAPATAEPQPEPDTSRILIVDDEGSIRDLFAGVFRPPVYHTLKAADGPSALALAKTNIFDLAFVDRVMPGMDGIEISKRLREIQPALKIVLISGYLIGDPGQAVEEARAQAFLAKPFSAVAVRSLAEQLLGDPGSKP